MQFVVSGAGGQLRSRDVRKRMTERHIAAWAPQRHFCVVEITRSEIRITPISDGPVRVVDRQGKVVAMPLKISFER